MARATERDRAELIRSLALLAERPGPGSAALAAALELPGPLEESAHTDLFVFQLPPYASIYLDDKGMLGGEAADRVAGFFRALGGTPAAEPDHLVTLLLAYAELLEATATPDDAPALAAMDRARSVLLFEHLCSWVPLYAAKAAEVALLPAYRRWAELLLEALLAEAEQSGPPDELPAQLSAAPEPLGIAGEPREFAADVLVTARSGMLCTRADLARGAERLGLGMRMGERRYMLAALIDQDAAGVVGWLAGEARTWAAWAAELEDSLGVIARFWRTRAEATVELLEQALADVGRGAPS